MALQVQSLSDVDPSLVQQAQDQISQILQEKFPEVEITRGVIHDIVTFLHSICAGVNQTTINRVLDSRSLLAIKNNPALADDTLVDHILSNFRITRKVGTYASGSINIVVEGDATIVVAADTLFFANGLNFRTTSPITARPPGTVTTSITDRVLQSRGDGTYEFTVPAVAEFVGESSNVRTNTKFTPATPQQRFVTSFSATDFTGGGETETNASLISRMEAGVAAPVTAGRLNIKSLVTSQPQFSSIKGLSIVGFGDPEMTRDQHSIIPISSGGRIDVYCRSTTLPKTVSLRKSATLVEKRTTDSIWQFTLTRDDAPGFYAVDAVRLLSDSKDVAGFEIISDQRGIDFATDSWTPDIKYDIEGAFTRYQTGIIRFVDTLTDTTSMVVGDKQDYSIDVLTQQLIGELQTFLASADYRCLGADILVKSVVPCFVTVNCTIVKQSTESAPDTDGIRVALADFVNNLDFPGVIYASQLMDVIHNSLQGSQAVGTLDMYGVITMPNRDRTLIRDKQALAIPNLPSQLVTAATATFILNPDNISINVINRS